MAIEGTFDPVVNRIQPHEHHNFLLDVIDGIIAILAAIASIVSAGSASFTWIGILEFIAEQTAIAAGADIATQGVSLAAGVQHKFNFKELAFSMGSAALAAGTGATATKLGADFLERLTISELTELLNQTMERSLHIEKHISWTGFVVASLNSINQSLSHSSALKSRPELAKTLDTLFSGIEATISGLQSQSGGHHDFNWTSIVANMIGTYTGESVEDDRASQHHLPQPAQTQSTASAPTPPTVGEQALARSRPAQAIGDLQSETQQHTAATHAISRHQRRATQQRAQRAEAD